MIFRAPKILKISTKVSHCFASSLLDLSNNVFKTHLKFNKNTYLYTIPLADEAGLKKFRLKKELLSSLSFVSVYFRLRLTRVKRKR